MFTLMAMTSNSWINSSTLLFTKYFLSFSFDVTIFNSVNSCSVTTIVISLFTICCLILVKRFPIKKLI